MFAVIWGVKKLQPHISSYPDVICENCKIKGYIDFYIYPQYVHVCWIPFFSMGKLFEYHCKKCGYIFSRQSLQKIPDNFQSIVKKEKQATKTPWYSFLGLYIFITYFLGIFFFQVQSVWIMNDQTQKYLSQPQIHDVYVIKNSNTEKYTVMKLMNMNQNEISFISDNSDLYRPSDAGKIELDEGRFEKNPFSKKISFPRPELESLAQKGDIYQIIRQ